MDFLLQFRPDVSKTYPKVPFISNLIPLKYPVICVLKLFLTSIAESF
jgi:hypothetical protein